jgi:two-component system chemotaxis response regulator CheY
MLAEKKVLLIYKDKILRRIVKEILRKIGFSRFVETDNRSEALANLMLGTIDLVVSDQNETVDGVEILKNWKENEKFKLVVFFIMTREGKTDVILSAGRAGVDGYILIPVGSSASDQKFLLQDISKRMKKVF